MITPQFLWVAFQAVHRDNSSTPPSDLLTDDNRAELDDLKSHGLPQNRYRLAEALMALDNAANSIVEALRGAHGGALGDDVIVAVHSDNGGDVCHSDYDGAPWGNNWPLRGRKMVRIVRCALPTPPLPLFLHSRNQPSIMPVPAGGPIGRTQTQTARVTRLNNVCRIIVVVAIGVHRRTLRVACACRRSSGRRAGAAAARARGFRRRRAAASTRG